MKVKCFIILCFIVAVTGGFLSSQEQMPAGGYKFANQQTSTAMPFKLINNLIVIPVELNGQTLNLVLDSGMPFDGAILFGSPKVDAIKLNYSSKVAVGGPDGQPVMSDASMGATLKVPNLALTNQTIIVLPPDPNRSRQFEEQDGIIGFSLFAHLIVSINYERQYMIITQPGTVDLTKAGHAVPVEVRDNRIFLKAAVQLENGATVPGEFVVDTGNRNALMLHPEKNDRLTLPGKTIPCVACGLTGKSQWKMGRITNFTLGDYQIGNVLASFNDGTAATPPWEKEGNLGNQILSRFHLTFDLSGNKIYFMKNNLFAEPFDFNLAGLQVERTEDKNLAVYHVIPGSPADKAGVAIGDKILSVNKKPVSKITRDEFENELEKNGKKVSVVLEHSGKQLNVNMKLERFI